MPSQNTEERTQQMIDKTGTSTFELDFKEGLRESLTEDYFDFDTSVGYFPTLKFTDMHVPAGTAKPYCLHVDWIRKERRH